jgi:hypothetical protein
MERFFRVVLLNIKDLRLLRGRNEASVGIVGYQGVGGGFDDFCHTITTRNDRLDRAEFNEIKGLADVAVVERRVIEKPLASRGYGRF